MCTIISKNALSGKKQFIMLSTTALIAGILIAPSSVYATDPAVSWNYDDAETSGNVSKDLDYLNHTTDITVTGGNGYVYGNADIYNGHTVNVNGDSGSTFAYHDNRDSIQTNLDGTLKSNMNVVVIDKNGVIFGNNAVVDVQSLIATSANVSDADVMGDGVLTFTDVENGGAIVNNGSITVAEAGLAAFVAPTIVNSGVINAKLGNVVMAAGQTVTLDLYGDGLVEVAVNGELADALITNRGQILAEGGKVKITAAAAKDTLSNVINNEGIIDVSSVTVEGGKIVLLGGTQGTVHNDGTLKTSEGGKVSISGERFVQGNQLGTAPDAAIVTGGGKVKIETTGNTEIYQGTIDAEGGNIYIDNAGAFYSAQANTLKTKGTGTISLKQNVGTVSILSSLFPLTFESVTATIQNAIDAIDNIGTGMNHITVGAGTYNESINVNHANLTLKGANAGIAAHKTSNRGAESLIFAGTDNGFYVTADNVMINGFDIEGGKSSIVVDGADNVSILNNAMANSTLHGVHVIGSDHATIRGSLIENYAEAGVYAEDSDYLVIGGTFGKYKNVVRDGHTGIRVYLGQGAQIIGNRIIGMSGTDIYADGIHIDSARDTYISGNTIKQVGDEGIFLRYTQGTVTVSNNDIYKVGLQSFGNGIELLGHHGSGIITGNIIGKASGDGILTKESKDSVVFFDVQNNTITNIAGSGILVDRAARTISGNTVNTTGLDGIRVADSDYATVSANTIRYFDGAGVHVDGSDFFKGQNNDIRYGHTGIFVSGGEKAKIKGNIIKHISGNDEYADGIYVVNTHDARIAGNIIRNTGNDGISVNQATGTTQVVNNKVLNTGLELVGSGIKLLNTIGSAIISGNKVENVSGDGILTDSSSDSVGFFEVANNNVVDAQGSGIVLDRAASLISGNTVTGAGLYGIKASKVDDATISDNVVTNSYSHGLYIAGADSGLVTLTGNIFTDNGNAAGVASARFESGEIDLSSETSPNSFVNTLTSPAVALQFADIAGDGSALSLVGNTIGSTIFSGYDNGIADNYYVRIENGTFVNPVTNASLLIDATNASFDGLVPSTFAGNILPLRIFNALKLKIFDVNDAPFNQRGELYFGALPEVADDNFILTNFQDFFKNPNLEGASANRVNVRINGLPFVDPNNISPAAGGNEAEQAAAINPAAGGDEETTDDVTCARDAAEKIGQGVVNYSFGGTFENSLADASGCQNG